LDQYKCKINEPQKQNLTLAAGFTIHFIHALMQVICACQEIYGSTKHGSGHDKTRNLANYTLHAL